MSTTVISQGYLGVLLTAISKKHREDVHESLSTANNGLSINYDGTLLQYDAYALKPYSKREFYGDFTVIGALEDKERELFVKLSKAAGFEVDPATVKPYLCIWYNGSDCPISELSKKNYLAGKV